jgi:hypothetical protein
MSLNLDNITRTIIIALETKAQTYSNPTWAAWNLHVVEMIKNGKVKIHEGGDLG